MGKVPLDLSMSKVSSTLQKTMDCGHCGGAGMSLKHHLSEASVACWDPCQATGSFVAQVRIG